MVLREIKERIKSNWQFKIFLSVFLNLLFAVLYLIPQHFTIKTAVFMKPCIIDRSIPFLPSTVYIYESLYLLMPIAPWLLKTVKELKSYSMGIIMMTCIGFISFMFFPTMISRPEYTLNNNFLYSLLIRLDSNLNACPSLHAAFAVFHCLCCTIVFNSGGGERFVKILLYVWTAGILLSTLTVKQHVLVDVTAGFVLGVISYIICCKDRINFVTH